MGKYAILLSVVLVLCLVACVGKSATVEETEPTEVAAKEEPATSTPLPPTSTAEPPSDTLESPTYSVMNITMSKDAQNTRKPTPIIPVSCAEVEGNCLFFAFDGENCVFEGPTDLKPGRTALIFLNKIEEAASLGFGRHHEGKTIQDMIEYVVTYLTVSDSPSPMPIPDWWRYQIGNPFILAPA